MTPLHPVVPLWCQIPYNTPLCLRPRFQIWSQILCPLLSLLDPASTDWHSLLQTAAYLPSSSAAVNIVRDWSSLLIPPYPKIFHPPIKIFLGSTVTLYTLQRIHWKLLSNFPRPPQKTPLPHEDLRETKYLGLWVRESGQGRPHLVLVPINIFLHIGNLLAEPFDGFSLVFNFL